ncbi:MAG TPA: hypothetical protein VF683_06350, partial [Chthoniobacterales bacterium]|jgi:thymidine phosphorylase
MGVRMSHLLSPMDEPLGRTVGNALEVAECVHILNGGGPDDLITLILDLAAAVSTVSREQLQQWLQDGTAWRKFVALVEAQGGDATTLERMNEVHRAPLEHRVPAMRSGTITAVDAETVGRASVFLGGGRQQATDAIDFAVGFSDIKKVGEHVDEGDALMTVHARNETSLAAVLPMLQQAVTIS